MQRRVNDFFSLSTCSMSDTTALLTHFGHWVQPTRLQTKGLASKPRWMPLP
jgi:hypothetical protein